MGKWNDNTQAVSQCKRRQWSVMYRVAAVNNSGVCETNIYINNASNCMKKPQNVKLE